MIYTMLPTESKIDYIYNAGVAGKLKNATMLDKLAPNKEKLHEYNEKITSSVYEKLGLKY